MACALICSAAPLDDELGSTLLWREELERRCVQTAEEALKAASGNPPEVVVIDRDLAGATPLVSSLRRDPRTRRVSIVVVARTDFEAVEVDLLEAGANAVLRLPASPEWDDRLARLIAVPVRREVRLPVQFELEARAGPGVQAAVALALNLSVSGVLLETDFDLKLGDDIDLRFHLVELDVTIVGCGRVVRHAGRRRYGIEFYGLEGEGHELVRRYVELMDIAEQRI
jgi:CheY-like chemotaxis protein